jgi:hypothetical protein
MPRSPWPSRDGSAPLRPLITRAPRILTATAGLSLAVALAACSSSGHSAAAGSASPSTASSSAGASSSASSGPTTSTGHHDAKVVIAGLITFKGKLQLHGAVNMHSSFSAFPGVTSPHSSCAHLAAVGTPGAKGAKPLFNIPAPADGSTVFFTAEVLPYNGPGTYGKSSILATGASITVGNAQYNPLAAGADATVTFHANGSGKFSFTDAAASKAGKPALSGTVTWKCSG